MPHKVFYYFYLWLILIVYWHIPGLEMKRKLHILLKFTYFNIFQKSKFEIPANLLPNSCIIFKYQFLFAKFYYA